jgi:hypothetical protein
MTRQEPQLPQVRGRGPPLTHPCCTFSLSVSFTDLPLHTQAHTHKRQIINRATN